MKGKTFKPVKGEMSNKNIINHFNRCIKIRNEGARKNIVISKYKIKWEKEVKCMNNQKQRW